MRSKFLKRCIGEFLKLIVNLNYRFKIAVRCRWGQAECRRQGVDENDPREMRRVLKEPLKYIRFPLMGKEEFALNVADKNVLDESELTPLFTGFLVDSPERRSALNRFFFHFNLNSFNLNQVFT